MSYDLTEPPLKKQATGIAPVLLWQDEEPAAAPAQSMPPFVSQTSVAEELDLESVCGEMAFSSGDLHLGTQPLFASVQTLLQFPGDVICHIPTLRMVFFSSLN